MFLQFMLFAVWWVPLAAYLDEIGITQKKHIFNTMAFGCMAAPIIGMFADRHFASQRLLAVLNIVTGVLLYVASTQTDPVILFILLLAAMLCYMPTWALTSSIAMSHSPSELFPQIRVFGSIGWVAAALFSIIALKVLNPLGIVDIQEFDATRLPLICGAATCIVAAVVNFTLPNTPPPAKGEKASVVDALGLKALSLMKDRNFALFIILSTLVMTPFMMWFNYGSQFLNDEGFKYLTATMNVGQFAEMFFMLLIPLALARMGIKWALVAGLAAQVVRYIAFWGGGVNNIQWLYFIAILVHGIIFGFFIVGGQIYVDKKANSGIRSQAQGLLFLITFGIGSLLANYINDFLINYYTTDDVTKWNSVWKVTTIISTALLIAFLLLFHDKFEKPSEGEVEEELKEVTEEELIQA